MLLEKERQEVVEYGIKMIEDGLTTGTAGNISVFNREKKLMAISPSGIDYYDTKPEDVVVIDLDGNIVDGNRKPSSEHDLHRLMYLNRDDCNAVVHTHSLYATAVACSRKPLPLVHYVLSHLGREVPCAEYALYGTEQLAKNAVEALGDDHKAVLLANHGTLTIGKDIAQAYRFSVNLEWGSQLYLQMTTNNQPVLLSDKEYEESLEKFKSYGQPKSKREGY